MARYNTAKTTAADLAKQNDEMQLFLLIYVPVDR